MIIKKGDITKTKGEYLPKAIVILVDEMSEVMNGSDYKIVSNIQENLGSIARLGRAAAVHLVLATQRPSANVISSDLKNNIHQSILLGDFDSGASSLLFDCDISHLAKPEISGRGFVKSGKDIIEFQAYWTTEKDFAYNEVKTTEEIKKEREEYKSKNIEESNLKNEEDSDENDSQGGRALSSKEALRQKHNKEAKRIRNSGEHHSENEELFESKKINWGGKVKDISDDDDDDDDDYEENGNNEDAEEKESFEKLSSNFDIGNIQSSFDDLDLEIEMLEKEYLDSQNKEDTIEEVIEIKAPTNKIKINLSKPDEPGIHKIKINI